jgi:hypothetical protein
MSKCLSTGWFFSTSRDPFGQVSIGNLKLRVSFGNTKLPPCAALCHWRWDFYGFGVKTETKALSDLQGTSRFIAV